jgi:tRNA pseudouridine32 synthase/23S rRNA pseudouridine746 synthase
VVEGWAPPLFDVFQRARLELDGDVAVKRLEAQLAELVDSDRLAVARADVSAFEQRAQLERAQLKQVHAERKAARQAARSSGGVDARALDDQSRADDRARRGLEARLRLEADQVRAPQARLERRMNALKRLRRLVSQQTMRTLHEGYRVVNARGEQRSLRACFGQVEPPWGAGDCAGPKLFAAAIDQGLRPVALAEFWWGPPPPGGGRVPGMFFPACKEKCGPLLPFMLEGFDLAPRRGFRPRTVARDELVTLYEDERLVVVVKPVGLLSVPAKDVSITDSVLARLRHRYPKARGPLLVHRLDLDTSGLLLAALDDEAHRVLQAQFIARTIEKEYLAVLDGEVAREAGVISLPLRVDLEQRPRQVVDAVHGKEAITEWRVLKRSAGLTQVSLVPRTGRTHQLRVHAAHHQGLGVAILGDRLYGNAKRCERLCLHAHRLTLTHPGTNGRLSFECPVVFPPAQPSL